MFALSETFGLSGYQKQSGTYAFRLLILFIICVFSRPANAVTNIYVFVPGQSAVVQTGGTGEPNDTCQIASAEQLCSIGSDPNLPYGHVFTRAVIAPNTNEVEGFQGTAFAGSLNGNRHINGNGHIITNLTIRNIMGDCLGLLEKMGIKSRAIRESGGN